MWFDIKDKLAIIIFPDVFRLWRKSFKQLRQVESVFLASSKKVDWGPLSSLQNRLRNVQLNSAQRHFCDGISMIIQIIWLDILLNVILMLLKANTMLVRLLPVLYINDWLLKTCFSFLTTDKTPKWLSFRNKISAYL